MRLESFVEQLLRVTTQKIQICTNQQRSKILAVKVSDRCHQICFKQLKCLKYSRAIDHTCITRRGIKDEDTNKELEVAPVISLIGINLNGFDILTE